MASRLPEETLHEILKHSFFISVLDAFVIIRDRSVSRYQRRAKPTKLLLVCKRWLRVATPLLYETIEIDSEHEMEKLAGTLRTVATVGSLIRNFRIEGRYGRHLHVVVEHAPNIAVLSVQTNSLSRFSDTGLLHALPCFNPTMVYLHDSSLQKNSESEANARAITTAVRSWK
ncbi:hypothetical protein BC835DRAFT_631914 [Cytidiella melzeri]|nr:hypothetical protein BC835DRAFT_631914 [Cytidiella melzeri]